MINPERQPGPVDSLNSQINEIFEEHIDIVASVEADIPVMSDMMALTGQLYGYYPKHSVKVELTTCLLDDDESGRVLRCAYFYYKKICVAEYIISRQQVLGVPDYQLLDRDKIADLSFWLSETRWNERDTLFYASKPVKSNRRLANG
ncbi:MAG TPA: hypothetical protein VMQ52_00550 [Candidatus Saccharimonadales bacterium]|jgi:hypothetical protein|nr:hypothetical protein [Candidatus Saccharimonadales bacterium]